MNRRGFLEACLTLAAAPAVVRADSLMRIVPRETLVIDPAKYPWNPYSPYPDVRYYSGLEWTEAELRILTKRVSGEGAHG